jgi:preprotein translocase subunit SecE
VKFGLTTPKYSLNLKKMTKRAKKNKVIFSNLAESLIEGEVDINDDSWPKKQDIISITALILSSINIVAIIWIIYKVRILCTALLLSKEIPRVNGLQLHTMPPTTTSPSWTTVLSETLRWDSRNMLRSSY